MKFLMLILVLAISGILSETTDKPEKTNSTTNRRNFDLLFPQPLVLGPFQALPAINHFARSFFDGSVNDEAKNFYQWSPSSSGLQDGFTPSAGANFNYNQQFDTTATTGNSYAPTFNTGEYSTINLQDVGIVNSGINSAANVDITGLNTNNEWNALNSGLTNTNLNNIVTQETGKFSSNNIQAVSSGNSAININNINTHDAHDDCNDYHGYHTLQGVYQTIQDNQNSYNGYQDSYQAPLVPALPLPQPTPAPQIITKEVRVPVPVPQPYPVTVEKKVPVPVPQPYPVQVVKNVPYRVEVKVPVPVPRPYPVRVTQKVPVYVKVPQPVKVEVPIPRPYPVEKRVPVPVQVKVPVFIRVPVPVHAENEGDHVDHIEIHHVGGRIHGHFVGSTSHFHGGVSDFHDGIIRDASEVHNHGGIYQGSFHESYQGEGIPAAVYGPPGYQPGTPISKRSSHKG